MLNSLGMWRSNRRCRTSESPHLCSSFVPPCSQYFLAPSCIETRCIGPFWTRAWSLGCHGGQILMKGVPLLPQHAKGKMKSLKHLQTSDWLVRHKPLYGCIALFKYFLCKLAVDLNYYIGRGNIIVIPCIYIAHCIIRQNFWLLIVQGWFLPNYQ